VADGFYRRKIRWKLMSHSGHLQTARSDEALYRGASPDVSILFQNGRSGVGDVGEPDHFRDLNLDQVVDAVVAGREEYDLVPFFRMPLGSVGEIEYRHDVFRDLEAQGVRDALREFGGHMHRVRSFLTLVRKQHYESERQRWLLDAALLYAAAVSDLSRALDGEELASEGLQAFASYLAEHVGGERFTALASQAAAVLEGLDRVTYSFRINGTRVTVSRFEEEPDYSVEIEALFGRFRQGDVESTATKVSDGGSMDHVEAQIAEFVARLFPDEFEALRRFCAAHADFVEPTIAVFDREIQFYLAWIDLGEGVAGADLAFCYPEVSSESKREVVEDAFDIALASKLRGQVVRNGYRLEDGERLLVVTGPNQGGKTTFARMVGQLHYLAALGVPVPARTARLHLVDRLFTHFEREEVGGSLRGKLDDELLRVREILDAATARSVVVLNEMFSSATLADARALGAEVLGRLIEHDCLGVCVTFIDELSRLGAATVSMVAQVEPDDPAKRTFRVVPQVADGRAYAWAIARKYGLSYEQLKERLS
jgi:DNA mismatch repair protein MutS